MIQAVFFDLNGVLITSEYLSKRFEDEYGVRNDTFVEALQEVMSVARKPGAPSVYSLWEPYFLDWDIDINEQTFLSFWFSGESVNTEALSYVAELKKLGIEVYVISNNFAERTGYYRETFPEIFEQLNGAYFSWETGNVKPSMASLEAVLIENNLDPEKVVYFDDSPKNIEVARELSVDGQLWVDLETAKEYVNSKL